MTRDCLEIERACPVWNQQKGARLRVSSLRTAPRFGATAFARHRLAVLAGPTAGEPNLRQLEPSNRLAAAAGGPPSCRVIPASLATGRHEGASSPPFALVPFVPPHGVITYGIHRV